MALQVFNNIDGDIYSIIDMTSLSLEALGYSLKSLDSVKRWLHRCLVRQYHVRQYDLFDRYEHKEHMFKNMIGMSIVSMFCMEIV